jgi:hypothetical protein
MPIALLNTKSLKSRQRQYQEGSNAALMNPEMPKSSQQRSQRFDEPRNAQIQPTATPCRPKRVDKPKNTQIELTTAPQSALRLDEHWNIRIEFTAAP